MMPIADRNRWALQAAFRQYGAKLLPREPTQSAVVERVGLCNGGVHQFWTHLDYSVRGAMVIAQDAYEARRHKVVSEWCKRQHKPTRRLPC